MSERAIFPLREWTAHTGAECTYPHSFTNTMIVACLPIHVLFASPLYPPLPWLETRPHFAVTSCTSLSTHAAVPHLLWPVPRGLHDRLIPPCALMTHPSLSISCSVTLFLQPTCTQLFVIHTTARRRQRGRGCDRPLSGLQQPALGLQAGVDGASSAWGQSAPWHHSCGVPAVAGVL